MHRVVFHHCCEVQTSIIAHQIFSWRSLAAILLRRCKCVRPKFHQSLTVPQQLLSGTVLAPRLMAPAASWTWHRNTPTVYQNISVLLLQNVVTDSSSRFGQICLSYSVAPWPVEKKRMVSPVQHLKRCGLTENWHWIPCGPCRWACACG